MDDVSARPQSPQKIAATRGGLIHEVRISWWQTDDWQWVVVVNSPELGAVERQANDAFEALCLLREELDPRGWRLGVAGARADVWPSGMARDQGGGLSAYRLGAAGPQDPVFTFSPVDPATVASVAEQRTAADRFFSKFGGGGR
ncbi:hypothetical protein [Microbacterium oxydans]|uniref:hypothetical protein n=1 Tax=Microbacterium oxydans TaxID=82380 RepID=UPI000B8034CA|nr:hypothetical protein [Microbacterium oxydans]